MTRHGRYPSHAFGSLSGCFPPSKNKNAGSRGAEEYEINRDHIIKYLFVATRKCDYDGQQTLNNYSHDRHLRLRMKAADALEKKSILGHRKINPRRREHSLAQESQRRDGNAGSNGASSCGPEREAHHIRRRRGRVGKTGNSQHAHTDEVYPEVEDDDANHADDESARQIFSRFAYLSRDEAGSLPTSSRERYANREKICRALSSSAWLASSSSTSG